MHYEACSVFMEAEIGYSCIRQWCKEMEVRKIEQNMRIFKKEVGWMTVLGDTGI